MKKGSIKSPEELAIMMEGGRKLARVRDSIFQLVSENVSASEIEEKATELIESAGGKPSFKMVPRYKWTTCINVNDGVVHGIPHASIVFKKGDVVSVDLGMFYQGFHTDTAFTKLIGEDPEKTKFLNAGKEALANAIEAAQPGNKVRDIAKATEDTLKKHKLNPIWTLTGHGVGKELHEEPTIPGFVSGVPDEQVQLEVGMTIAIEVMYTTGSGDIILSEDRWTLSTKDAKISALFEETVAITNDGPVILTKDGKTK